MAQTFCTDENTPKEGDRASNSGLTTPSSPSGYPPKEGDRVKDPSYQNEIEHMNLDLEVGIGLTDFYTTDLLLAAWDAFRSKNCRIVSRSQAVRDRAAVPNFRAEILAITLERFFENVMFLALSHTSATLQIFPFWDGVEAAKDAEGRPILPYGERKCPVLIRVCMKENQVVVSTYDLEDPDKKVGVSSLNVHAEKEHHRFTREDYIADMRSRYSRSETRSTGGSTEDGSFVKPPEDERKKSIGADVNARIERSGFFNPKVNAVLTISHYDSIFEEVVAEGRVLDKKEFAALMEKHDYPSPYRACGGFLGAGCQTRFRFCDFQNSSRCSGCNLLFCGGSAPGSDPDDAAPKRTGCAPWYDSSDETSVFVCERCLLRNTVASATR